MAAVWWGLPTRALIRAKWLREGHGTRVGVVLPTERPCRSAGRQLTMIVPVMVGWIAQA
jgi:hypothetical protein